MLLTGHASIFNEPDLVRDIVLPGAFAETLRRRGPHGVRMLWQHDPSEPIGSWLSMVEDRRGLRVSGRLDLNVQRAREVVTLVRQGALDGLSIGFRTLKASHARAGRRLQSLDLWEVSVVSHPLHPAARLTLGPADSLDIGAAA